MVTLPVTVALGPKVPSHSISALWTNISRRLARGLPCLLALSWPRPCQGKESALPSGRPQRQRSPGCRTRVLKETTGRLGQVCDRWIYSACLCFGLDLDEQSASGFHYDYSVYQVEFSRNLLFASGAEMESVFDRIIDRSRARLDVRQLRTLFGQKQRPRKRSNGESRLAKQS